MALTGASPTLQRWLPPLATALLFFLLLMPAPSGIAQSPSPEAGPAAERPVTQRLAAMWRAWLAPQPWNQGSINVHGAGAQPGKRLTPVVLLGVLTLLLGLPGYWRWGSRFLLAWMLVAWLLLDLVWQRQLLWRGQDTREQFAGLPAADRPAQGDDSFFWAVSQKTKAQLPAAGARVFVASANDFVGMRMAYYLYPLNVYWRRGGPELPGPSQFRTGDYILLVEPTAVRPLSGGGRLRYAGETWLVRPVARMADASLYQVR